MANNLKKFNTESEYNQATLSYPAVSWVVSGDTVHFDKEAPAPPAPTYDYVALNDEFSTSTGIYGINFIDSGLGYNTANVQLYDNPQATGTPVGFYNVTKDNDNRMASVLLSLNNQTIVDRWYDDNGDKPSIEGFNGYVEFTGPLYTSDRPSSTNCLATDCVEYCCNEFDPETGECIDYSPDCCREECVSEEHIYLCTVKIIQQ